MELSNLETIGKTFDFIFLIIPIVGPVILGIVLVKMWISYARKSFFLKQEHKLVQILPPTIVTKTPLAMELFLISLHQTSGESTWYDRYVKGQTRPIFSLEIVSEGGEVKFFIWGRSGFVKQIESQLYAQYSGIEVAEVEDYSKFKIDLDKYSIAAAELKLTAPDPYPIKTYVDYGLDKETEEEFKIDPMTPMIESLGSLPRGHKAWIQIIIRAHKAEDKDPNKMFGKIDGWTESAKSEIKKIRKDSLVESGTGENKKSTPDKTKGQELRIAALERSVSKLSFDTGIRFIYTANKDDFDKGYFGGVLSSFKQYNSLDLNGFKPSITPGFDYPWQDRSGVKKRKQEEEMIEAYKERGFFWREYPKFGLLGGSISRQKFVLNTEELATIFHFPGGVAQTPSLDRVLSKKSTPPANLPI